MRRPGIVRVLLLAAIAGAVAAAPGSSATHATDVPRISTAVSVSGVIRSFDISGGELAWIEATWELKVRAIAGGETTTIRYTSQYQENGEPPPLGLSGRRASWVSTRGFPDILQRVYTATTANPRPRQIERETHTDALDGGYVTSLSSDSEGAAYGIVTMRESAKSKTSGCFCEFAVAGGGVRVVDAGARRTLAGAPPPVFVARSTGRVAVVPASTSAQKTARPAPASGGPLQVRNIRDGTIVSSFTPSGEVRAIALAATLVGVLVVNGGTRRIEAYDARTGHLLRTVRLLGVIADDLSASGQRIVFHTNRSVSLFDVSSGRLLTVATTASTITRAVIDGRIAAWSERLTVHPGDESVRKNYRARIRFVRLT